MFLPRSTDAQLTVPSLVARSDKIGLVAAISEKVPGWVWTVAQQSNFGRVHLSTTLKSITHKLYYI